MPPLAPPSDLNPKKRKQPPGSSQSSGKTFRQKKRTKLDDARAIATQTADSALKDGEIDVDKFVRARDFEIRALEDGMRRSKNALTTRAFQEVPRGLRRRAASHNVRRIPKRLRNRARREMIEDNTPTSNKKPTSHQRLRLETVARLRQLAAKTKAIKATKRAERNATGGQGAFKVPDVKKNALQKPLRPKARFRKRQVYKSWLPTHVYHAKRAHMTPPKEPLWRFAIPLTPNEKSYRVTHRAMGTRGAIAWDKSYMSTIGLEGSAKSLQGVLKALGIGIGNETFWSSRHTERWMNGTRFWEGWVHERDTFPHKSIAPVSIIWCAVVNVQQEENNAAPAADTKMKRKKNKRQLLIRVHPSAFLTVWEELIRVCKIQKPAVMLEDLRFEIGSIEITGPAATKALVNTLWPSAPSAEVGNRSDDSPEMIWSSFGHELKPSNLPLHALLAFEASDPRLHYPPRPTEPTTNGIEAQSKLLHLLTKWPVDRTLNSQALFSRATRLVAQRALSAQKSINRRKALASPGAYPEPKSTDSRIPVILMAHRSSINLKSPPPAAKSAERSGSWTLLVPWKCVLPIWYCLLHQPLSTGGQPRFGGLNETRQVTFENNNAWFPCDYPGTPAGQAWELQERSKRHREWAKRPKGKRVEFSSVNLGDGAQKRKGELGEGWACDWERLLNIPPAEKKQDDTLLLSGEERKKEEKTLATPWQLPFTHALRIFRTPSIAATTPNSPSALATVHLTLLTRGAPSPCARIYRLPTSDRPLRARWLSLLRSSKTLPKQSTFPSKPPPEAPSHERRRWLAASLLDPALREDVKDDQPSVPPEQDLIGFVTTGGFNLGEGKGAAMGAVVLHRALDLDNGDVLTGDEGKEVDAKKQKEQERLCIIREAGYALGRLARWSLIE